MKALLSVLVALTALECAADDLDLAELGGVVPGEPYPESMPRWAGKTPYEMPFVFFNAPTRLPEIAEIVPDFQLYMLKDGTVVGLRWRRVFATSADCEAAADAIEKILIRYLPRRERIREYELHSTDLDYSGRVVCGNGDIFPTLYAELVHPQSEKEMHAQYSPDG